MIIALEERAVAKDDIRLYAIIQCDSLRQADQVRRGLRSLTFEECMADALKRIAPGSTSHSRWKGIP